MAKIVDANFEVLEYPFKGYFKFIGPRAVRGALLVRIEADNGLVGWGQSLPVPTWSYETMQSAAAVLRRQFLPAVLGQDAEDLPGLRKRLDRALAPSFSTPMPITRAGVEMALEDLAAKIAGQSLVETWGRTTGNGLALSWTINVQTFDELEEEIERGQGRGYEHFNIKIGGGDADFDVELARRVRKLAPRGFLWTDANCGYDEATARAIAPRLADVGVDVLESPLPANHISGYQALHRQGALPITMDEGVISPIDAAEFIRLKMVDGLTIKVSRSGGLESARRQIECVLDAGLFWLGSGLSDPDLSLAASLILFSAYGLNRPAALNGPQYLPDSILAQPLTVVDGWAQIPQGPGLGVQVDPDKIAPLRKAKRRSRDVALV